MVEREVCEIWSNQFGVVVSPHDGFFDLGGDSLKVVDVVMVARKRGLTFRSSAVFRNPTPARLAETLTLSGRITFPDGAPAVPEFLREPGDAASNGTWSEFFARSPEPIDSTSGGETLFAVHSLEQVQAERDALSSWDLGRPVHSLTLPGAHGPDVRVTTVSELADRCLGHLLRVQPVGPYFLVGFGEGAVVALELAQRLIARSQKVARLVLIKPVVPAVDPGDRQACLDERLIRLARRFGLTGQESPAQVLSLIRRTGWYSDEVRAEGLAAMQATATAMDQILAGHQVDAHSGRVVVVQETAVRQETLDRWGLADAETHEFDYGLESSLPILADPDVADLLRKELSR